MNLSGALTIFVAQNSGAGNPERIRRGVRQCVAVGLALTAVVSALLVTQRSTIAALFTTDAELQALTGRYVLITFPFFALYTFMVLTHGGFNGVGRTVVPLICTVLSFLIVRIPLSYLLGSWFGIDGLMWAVVFGWLVGACYTAIAGARRPIGAGKSTSIEEPSPTRPGVRSPELSRGSSVTGPTGRERGDP